MSVPLKIEKLYAWVAVDHDGSEGIIAKYEPAMRAWAPAVGADKERIESYRDLAEDAAQARGVPVKLCEFSTLTVLETIQPDKN